MDDTGDEESFAHKYNLINGNGSEANRSICHLEPNHTHFHFFDEGISNEQNILLKRQEIEHELSISKVLSSPMVGYQPESTSMYCQS
jgi:hypothetical protein